MSDKMSVIGMKDRCHRPKCAKRCRFGDGHEREPGLIVPCHPERCWPEAKEAK